MNIVTRSILSVVLIALVSLGMIAPASAQTNQAVPASQSETGSCPFGELVDLVSVSSPGKLVIHFADCAEGFGDIRIWMEKGVREDPVADYQQTVPDMKAIAGKDIEFVVPSGVTRILFHVWNAEGRDLSALFIDVPEGSGEKFPERFFAPIMFGK